MSQNQQRHIKKYYALQTLRYGVQLKERKQENEQSKKEVRK